MYLLKRVLVLLMLGACLPAGADVASDMTSFFNSMGFDANVTPGGAYQGQTAGYYTGGSVFARTPVRNYNLASIQFPSYRAGCGGIDLFTGGFSFINSDQLVAMMKNIGSNAVGLAFQIALSTISPKLSQKLQDFQDMANKINNTNLNSCSAAADLLSGIVPKTKQSQASLCQAMGNSTGYFSDYAQAREECGSGGQTSSVTAAAQNNPQWKDMLATGNIAWRALTKVVGPSGGTLNDSDVQLAEMMMSLTGTIIMQPPADDNSPVDPQMKPPTIQTDADLKSFLYGGSITIYQCDTTTEFGCLSPTTTTVTLNQNTAFAARVKSMLDDIVTRMQTDHALSGEELALLNDTSMPIYKMLNVAVAYSPSSAQSWADNYSEMISVDILYKYLRSLQEEISYGANNLQLPQALSSYFDDKLTRTRSRIELMRKQKTAQVAGDIEMMQSTMTMERMLISSLSPGLAGSVRWAQGMQ